MSVPFPKYVEWQITARCDHRCLHCNNIPTNDSFDLSTASAVRLIHQLTDENVKGVTLSGGEPFARDDWELLVSVLKDNGISVQLISNGSLLETEHVTKLKNLRVDFVWLSLDGPKSAHNFIRQNRHSFDHVMNAATALKTAGVPFGFMTTLLLPNYQTLPKMAQIVREKEAGLWQLWLGNRTNHREIWLSNEQINDLLSTLPAIRLKAPQMIVGDNIGYSSRLENLRAPGFTVMKDTMRFRGCYGGKEVIGIRNNGAVQTCLALPSSPTQRTVNDLPVAELHRLALGNNQAVLQRLAPFCDQCENAAACARGCQAHLLSQSMFEGTPYCRQKRSSHNRIAQTVSASLLAACALSATHCRPQNSETTSPSSINAASDDRTFKKAKQLNPFALNTDPAPSHTAPAANTAPAADSDSVTDTISATNSRNAAPAHTNRRPCMMSHVGCRDTFEQLSDPAQKENSKK